MIPQKMKAWILTEPRKLELKEVLVPPITEQQVLIEIERGCICNGSDPSIFHGHESYETPMIFGHEACGRIVKKGKEVSGFEIGDRVCWWFATGAFAEYQVVEPNEVAMFQIPKGLTLEEGPVLELVIASCRAIMKLPAEERRKTLSVCGLGPSGLILIQYARTLGYEQIVGWDLYRERRELAVELGIDITYDPAIIMRYGYREIPLSDVGVMMMGDDLLLGEPTADIFMKTIREGGCLVSYGHPEKGRKFSPYIFQSRNLKMQGPVNDLEIIRKEGKKIMQMIVNGKIRIRPLISKQINFEEFLPAFERLMIAPEEQIKVILKWRDKK